jgi:DNA repair protein RadC
MLSTARALLDEEGPLEELLAALLGISRDRAASVLTTCGGLEQLARMDAHELSDCLRRVHVSRPARGAEATVAAFELGRRAVLAAAKTPERFQSSADVARWAGPRLGALQHEELWVLALDARGHLRAARCVAKGGIHGVAVRATDPLKVALRAAASGFVLVHNHPSGDPTPSPEDLAFTDRVVTAARVVGVPLMDHVVVGRDGFASVPLREGEDA